MQGKTTPLKKKTRTTIQSSLTHSVFVKELKDKMGVSSDGDPNSLPKEDVKQKLAEYDEKFFGLDERIVGLIEDTKKINKEQKKTNNFLFAVVLVLIFQLAAIIIPLLYSYTQEIRDLRKDQYEFSIERIERLESIVIPTPTLTPTPATE